MTDHSHLQYVTRDAFFIDSPRSVFDIVGLLHFMFVVFIKKVGMKHNQRKGNIISLVWSVG